jgi:hypothetical protein
VSTTRSGQGASWPGLGELGFVVVVVELCGFLQHVASYWTGGFLAWPWSAEY